MVSKLSKGSYQSTTAKSSDLSKNSWTNNYFKPLIVEMEKHQTQVGKVIHIWNGTIYSDNGKYLWVLVWHFLDSFNAKMLGMDQEKFSRELSMKCLWAFCEEKQPPKGMAQNILKVCGIILKINCKPTTLKKQPWIVIYIRLFIHFIQRFAHYGGFISLNVK